MEKDKKNKIKYGNTNGNSVIVFFFSLFLKTGFIFYKMHFGSVVFMKKFRVYAKGSSRPWIEKCR